MEVPTESACPAQKRRRLSALMKLDVIAYEFQKYESWAFELSGDDHGLPDIMVKEA